MKPILDGRNWRGETSRDGTTYLAELWESDDSPGYYHHAVFKLPYDVVHTKRPISSKLDGKYVMDGLSEMLAEHRLTINDLTWGETPTLLLGA